MYLSKLSLLQIEDTMDLIREEMTLLAEVDQPGSLIDSYVDKLEALLVRKAEGMICCDAIFPPRTPHFTTRSKHTDLAGVA